MEILVLHPGALGDIILSLPALRLLRERFQDARITLAANTDFAIAVASGYADTTFSLAALPLHRLYDSSVLPAEDLRFWRFYDRIVSWTGSASEQFTSRLASLHPCVIASSWKPEPDEPRHVADLFARSLQPWLRPPAVTCPPRVKLDPASRQRGAEWLREHGWDAEKPVVAMHPGAGGPAKRWPLDHFKALAERLRTDAGFLVIEGPAEPGLGRSLAEGLGHCVVLAQRPSLELLAQIISHCRVFVGNDSGIAHLAAALQIPSVVLFGPTLPRHWAPPGPHVTVLRQAENCPACNGDPDAPHSCMPAIPVEAVLRQLNSMLP